MRRPKSFPVEAGILVVLALTLSDAALAHYRGQPRSERTFVEDPSPTLCTDESKEGHVERLLPGLKDRAADHCKSEHGTGVRSFDITPLGCRAMTWPTKRWELLIVWGYRCDD